MTAEREDCRTCANWTGNVNGSGYPRCDCSDDRLAPLVSVSAEPGGEPYAFVVEWSNRHSSIYTTAEEAEAAVRRLPVQQPDGPARVVPVYKEAPASGVEADGDGLAKLRAWAEANHGEGSEGDWTYVLYEDCNGQPGLLTMLDRLACGSSGGIVQTTAGKVREGDEWLWCASPLTWEAVTSVAPTSQGFVNVYGARGCLSSADPERKVLVRRASTDKTEGAGLGDFAKVPALKGKTIRGLCVGTRGMSVVEGVSFTFDDKSWIEINGDRLEVRVRIAPAPADEAGGEDHKPISYGESFARAMREVDALPPGERSVYGLRHQRGADEAGGES